MAWQTVTRTESPAAASAQRRRRLPVSVGAASLRRDGWRILPDGLQLHPLTISALIVLAVVLYYVRAWGDVLGYLNALGGPEPVSDYTAFYYPAGREVLERWRPAEGYLYSMFSAFCLAPVSYFSLYTAIWIWSVVQVVFLGLLLALPAREFLRANRRAFYLYLLIFLCSYPALDCLKWGQASTMLLACILGCFYLYRSGYIRLAAAVLAFAVSIKFYPVLFLAYFLIRRDYRFVVICFMFTALFAVAIPIWLSSTGAWIGYHHDVYGYLNTMRYNFRNMANAHYVPYRVFHLYGGTIHDMSQVEFLRRLSLGVAAINLLIINRLCRLPAQQGMPWAFVLLFCSMPFVIESCWPHYLAYLPFCQTFLALSFGDGRPSAGDLAKGLLLLAPSILLSSLFMLNWLGDWQPVARYCLLLVANAQVMILTWLQMPSIRGTHLAPAPGRNEPAAAIAAHA